MVQKGIITFPPFPVLHASSIIYIIHLNVTATFNLSYLGWHSLTTDAKDAAYPRCQNRLDPDEMDLVDSGPIKHCGLVCVR